MAFFLLLNYARAIFLISPSWYFWAFGREAFRHVYSLRQPNSLVGLLHSAQLPSCFGAKTKAYTMMSYISLLNYKHLIFVAMYAQINNLLQLCRICSHILSSLAVQNSAPASGFVYILGPLSHKVTGILCKIGSILLEISLLHIRSWYSLSPPLSSQSSAKLFPSPRLECH